MLNLFPKQIAKNMDGRKLTAFAVLEKEGTKICSQDDFIYAYHHWGIFSVTRNALREYRRRSVSVAFFSSRCRPIRLPE